MDSILKSTHSVYFQRKTIMGSIYMVEKKAIYLLPSIGFQIKLQIASKVIFQLLLYSLGN